MEKSYNGNTLLCRTEIESKLVAGRISFSPERIKVKLVGFEDFFYFEGEDTISLRLEDNKYCTARPFSTSPGSTSSAHDICHFLEFDVRQAIIGFRPWNSDDRIKEFHFSLSDTNGLLEAPDIRLAIKESKIGDDPKTRIIEASSGGATVTISYSYSIDWRDGKYSVSDAYGCVKFEKPQSTGEVSEFVAVLRTFFTMAAGIEVQTSDYWITPQKDHEQPLLGGGTAPASFQLIWPTRQKEKFENFKVHRPTSVLRCFDETERASTNKCLQFWMDNWAAWKPAFTGLLLATREGNTFDRNRIVNACKWLESTPGAEQRNLQVDGELQQVLNVAIGKAEDLGLNLRERISGAINNLKTESRNDLFKRLLDIQVPQNNPEFKSRFLKDMHKAYSIRGSFAHRKFEHKNDEEFGEYVRCTQAVEALAFLLLFRSLPLPNDHHWGHGPNNFTEYLHLP